MNNSKKHSINIDLLRILLFEYITKNTKNKLFNILYLNFYDNILEVLYYLHTIENELIENYDNKKEIEQSNRNNKNELFGISCYLLNELIIEEKYDIKKITKTEDDMFFLSELMKIDFQNWSSYKFSKYGQENIFKYTILYNILTHKNINYITENYECFSKFFKIFTNKDNQYVFFTAYIIENYSQAAILEFLDKIKSDNNKLYNFISISIKNE